ncbi:MAG: thymidylate synthase [Patescibacteria group bacterium]
MNYYKDLLKAGDLKSPVVIISLWTICDEIVKDVDPSLFKIAGQLYTKNGLNYLVRNLLADKEIRYLVVCGQDRSGSGAELLNLWQTGKSQFLHKEITPSSIENLIKNVKLINLIGVEDGAVIEAEIRKLDLALGSYGEAEFFPEPANPALSELECSFPSDISGFKVRGATIAEAWLKTLKHILRFGDIKETDGMKMKEIVNLVAVIENEDPDNFNLPDWFNIDKKRIDEYVPQVLSGDKIPGLHYTYGNRLQGHFKVNQIERIIRRLKEDINAREAIGVLFDPNIDFEAEHRPCIVLVQALRNHFCLSFTAYVRSHDVFGGWPLNAFGLRKLQKQIADAAGVPMGPLTLISASAHIYDFNWNEALKMVNENLRNDFEIDPRGYFKIDIDKEKKEIITEHFTPEGLKLQKFTQTIDAPDAAKILARKIEETLSLSLISHASYLGIELMKAEAALRLGVPYIQDEILMIK